MVKANLFFGEGPFPGLRTTPSLLCAHMAFALGVERERKKEERGGGKGFCSLMSFLIRT